MLEISAATSPGKQRNEWIVCIGLSHSLAPCPGESRGQWEECSEQYGAVLLELGGIRARPFPSEQLEGRGGGAVWDAI